MQQLYILRHGQIPQITPRRFIGCTDVPLDQTGKEQAAAMGQALKNVRLDKAICSDLGRTMHTARLALQGRPTPMQAEPMPLLREINLGRWEGMTKDEVKAAFPGQFEQRGNDLGGFVPEQGESFAQVQKRAARFLDMMKNDDADTALAVTHAGFIRTLLCLVRQTPLDRLFDMEMDYCRLTLLILDQGSWQVRFANMDAPTFSRQNA